MLGGSCNPCCGDWYCYNQCADFSCPDSTSVSVSLSASDTLINAVWKYTPENRFSGLPTYWQKETLFFRGSEINGTHALANRPDLTTATQSVWESSTSFWASCPTGGVNQMTSRKIRLTLSRTSSPSWSLTIPAVGFAWRSENLSAEPSPSGFRSPQDFNCDSLCDRCSVSTRTRMLAANCNTSTGAVSFNWEGYVPVAGFPVEFIAPLPAAGMSSDYGRSVVYASVPYQSDQLPDLKWYVNSVAFGS